MRTFFGSKFTTVIIAATLFITVSGSIPVYAYGDAAAYKAAKKKAADKVKAAEELKKKCDELKAKAAAAQAAAAAAQAAADAANNAADEAKESTGDTKNPVEDAADAAAAAADDALDAAARNPGDKDAKQKAKDLDDEANKKDWETQKGNPPFSGADRSPRQKARFLQREARAAARAAAVAAAIAAAAEALVEAEHPCGKADKALAEADAAIAAFEKLLAEKVKKTGGSSETRDDTGLVDGWKKKIHPGGDDTAKEPAKSMEPPKPGIVIEPGAGDVKATTSNGLQTVTFDTLQGTVIVNLPAEIRAGDTISGTVFTEPKGNTAEEKAANKNVLNATILDLAGTRIQGGDEPRFSWTPSMPQTPVQYRLKIVEVLGNPTPMTQSGAVITPNPTTTQSGPLPTKFNIPSLGQTGRNFTVTGKFDGDSWNTNVSVQPSSGPATDLLILAETKSVAVLRSPTNLTGPMRLSVTDGTTMTTAVFRNVGVNLTAPKTKLLKDEKTTMTVTMNGLQGLKEPISVSLQSSGVITMSGGMNQTLTVKPSQVGADGTYSTTREITGVQAGGWSATATVQTPMP